MDFVNRICPNCKNPNYVVFLGDFSKAFKYKCTNCNQYFNDVNVKEPLQPVWKSECMNKKADMVEVVRCKDCKHYRYYGLSSDTVSECRIDHEENPDAEWFCADGEREDS